MLQRCTRRAAPLPRVGLLLALLLPAITACKHNDYAAERLAMRRANIDAAVESALRREAKAPEHLKAASAWMEAALKRDARDTQEQAELTALKLFY